MAEPTLTQQTVKAAYIKFDSAGKRGFVNAPFTTRYNIRRHIKSGGMGSLFVAFDRILEREVAIKLTPLDSDEEMINQFLREARLHARLRHPNIVPIHDFGAIEAEVEQARYNPETGETYSEKVRKPHLFIVEQLIEGHDMTKALEELREGKGDWPRRRLIDIFLKVCDAMSYAHDQQIIHRDIKPGNVMFNPNYNAVYVIDWGLARIKGGVDLTGSLLKLSDGWQTLYGTAKGTPYYMSPEQAAGEIDKIDERSDIYNLGVMLYEFLTGTTPYGHIKNTWELLDTLKDPGIKPPAPREKNPSIPPNLEEIVMRCIEKDPTKRYQRIDELREELDRFVSGKLQWILEKAKAQAPKDAISTLEEAIRQRETEWENTKEENALFELVNLLDNLMQILDKQCASGEQLKGKLSEVVKKYSIYAQMLSNNLGRKALRSKSFETTKRYLLAENLENLISAAEISKREFETLLEESKYYRSRASAIADTLGITLYRIFNYTNNIEYANEALDWFKKALELTENERIKIRALSNTASILGYAGIIFNSSEYLQKARKFANEALVLAESVKNNDSLGLAHLAKADIEFKCGNLKEAEKHYIISYKTGYDIWENALGLAKCSLIKGNIEEAEEYAAIALPSNKIRGPPSIRDDFIAFARERGYEVIQTNEGTNVKVLIIKKG